MSLKLTRKHDKDSKVWLPCTNVSFSTTCLFFVLSTHTHACVWIVLCLKSYFSVTMREFEAVFPTSVHCRDSLSSLGYLTWNEDLRFFSALWKSIGVLDKIQPFKNIFFTVLDRCVYLRCCSESLKAPGCLHFQMFFHLWLQWSWLVCVIIKKQTNKHNKKNLYILLKTAYLKPRRLFIS